jgi:hypothetical protein
MIFSITATVSCVVSIKIIVNKTNQANPAITFTQPLLIERRLSNAESINQTLIMIINMAIDRNAHIIVKISIIVIITKLLNCPTP